MSLFIALPCHGGIVTEKTTMGLFNLGKLLVRNNISHGLLTQANSSLITQGRSKCANFFINNTDHEYILFLDSDIGFKAEDVLKLLNHKVDIVSATYPMKTIPIRYCVNAVEPEQKRGDLLKIEGNGMGFTLIHRNVFGKIAQNYPELKYIPADNSNFSISQEENNNSYHFFMEHKKENKFLSEDKSFFYRASMVGYDIWLDTTIRLQHLGSHIFGE